MIFRLFVVTILLSTYGLSAQVKNFIPNAPVINFKLAVFNDEGYRLWAMQGEKGIYANEDKIEVVGMVVDCYSGDERERLEANMNSPQATVLIKEDRAYGDDIISVKGNGYYLEGKNWDWEVKGKKVAIKKDVRVILNQSLEKVLNYEIK